MRDYPANGLTLALSLRGVGGGQDGRLSQQIPEPPSSAFRGRNIASKKLVRVAHFTATRRGRDASNLPSHGRLGHDALR